MKSNRKPAKKRKSNPFFVVLFGTALILAGTWSYQLIELDSSMEERKSELLRQKNTIAAQNDKLRQEIEKLNTPSYIEQLAREKLGLVRKGEIIIAPKQS